jgi:hypothetical protein
MVDLGDTLRLVNAALSVPFCGVVFYVYWVSKHHGSRLYRFGMLSIAVGLIFNVVHVSGLTPPNFETWLFKDFGIYLAVSGIVWQTWRERRMSPAI